MIRGRLMMLVVGALLAVALAQPTLAAFARNTIDPDAELRTHGRQALVTVIIECTAGEQLRVDVTVTQESSGAWGTGHAQLWCTGSEQRWPVLVNARGATAFEEGHAEADAVGITRFHGKETESRQWRAVNGITLD